jgi:hypothetical protein
MQIGMIGLGRMGAMRFEFGGHLEKSAEKSEAA